MPPKLPPIQREFVFTDDDFDRIRRFIHQRAGIALNPSKKTWCMVLADSALATAAVHRLSGNAVSERGNEELEHFVNALTTNPTYFFAKNTTFRFSPTTCAASGEVNIWCCAASTGEEPYSLAMTALETASNGASECQHCRHRSGHQCPARRRRGRLWRRRSDQQTASRYGQSAILTGR